MTCVWNALLQKIQTNDLKTLLGVTNHTPHELVKALKAKNCATVGVKWQGTELTRQQISENMKHVEVHDIGSIGNGYDCSACDAYMILVCYILKVRILHQYLNTQIVYDPPGPSRYTLSFANNAGHFW